MWRAGSLIGMAEQQNTTGLPPGLDRRGFLRASAGAGAAAALAALLPVGCAPGSAGAQQAAGLASLTVGELRTARAAAEALVGGLPVSSDAIALRLDRELALVGGPIERDMKTVLRLMERLTPLGGHLRRFSELSPEDRLAYLHTWRDSRFSLRRAAFNAVRSFVYFFAYADPATWTLTGFPGPWPGRVDIPAYPVDFGGVV